MDQIGEMTCQILMQFCINQMDKLRQAGQDGAKQSGGRHSLQNTTICQEDIFDRLSSLRVVKLVIYANPWSIVSSFYQLRFRRLRFGLNRFFQFRINLSDLLVVLKIICCLLFFCP